jgi:hypothetical protein
LENNENLIIVKNVINYSKRSMQSSGMFTLIVESIGSSETLVRTTTTCYNTPEYIILQNLINICQNNKYHIMNALSIRRAKLTSLTVDVIFSRRQWQIVRGNGDSL